MSHICILGEGAWGTAIATVLAHNGHNVVIWCYDQTICEDIAQTRRNSKYFPDLILDEHIQVTSDVRVALSNAFLVCEAIPVKFLRSVLERASAYVTHKQPWLILSKGIEQETLLFPSQIVNEIVGANVAHAVLSGPSFAHDVVRRDITGVTLATTTHEVGVKFHKLFANDFFKPDLSSDMIGVQAAAALKNVIALLIGMLEGAGYGDNTKAFMLTRGLQEIAVLTKTLGGNTETVYGLSGVGDLVLTATSSKSRNCEVGKLLGAGESLETILQKTGYIPEGINTVISVHQLMHNYNLDLPLCSGVYALIMKKKPLKEFMHELMNAPLDE